MRICIGFVRREQEQAVKSEAALFEILGIHALRGFCEWPRCSGCVALAASAIDVIDDDQSDVVHEPLVPLMPLSSVRLPEVPGVLLELFGANGILCRRMANGQWIMDNGK